MSILDRLKPKRQLTHFERDSSGAVTDVRRYNITGGTRAEPIPDLEPIDELEADTDVKEMEKEYKQVKREQKMVELEAKHSEFQKKKAMKLEDLRQKKEMKELKGDIRKMKYAPIYKTGSGLLKMGKAVRERGDSGFVGGGQDKVSLDEGAVGDGKNGGFFDFGSKGKVDWSGGKKTELSLTGGKGKGAIDWGAKSQGKIDFSLGIGQKSAPKKRKKSKKKGRKK